MRLYIPKNEQAKQKVIILAEQGLELSILDFIYVGKCSQDTPCEKGTLLIDDDLLEKESYFLYDGLSNKPVRVDRCLDNLTIQLEELAQSSLEKLNNLSTMHNYNQQSILSLYNLSIERVRSRKGVF